MPGQSHTTKASALFLLAGWLAACASVGGMSVRLDYAGTIPALPFPHDRAVAVGVLPFQDARIATGPTVVTLALDEQHQLQLELEPRVPLANRLTDETVAVFTRSGLPALRLEASGEGALPGAPGPGLLLQGILVEFNLRREANEPHGTVPRGEAHVLLRFLDPVARRPLAGKLLWSVVTHRYHGGDVGPAEYQEAASKLWERLLQSIGAAVPLDLLERAPREGPAPPGRVTIPARGGPHALDARAASTPW